MPDGDATAKHVRTSGLRLQDKRSVEPGRRAHDVDRCRNAIDELSEDGRGRRYFDVAVEFNAKPSAACSQGESSEGHPREGRDHRYVNAAIDVRAVGPGRLGGGT